jgi:N4-gp56 family major capsid protein
LAEYTGTSQSDHLIRQAYFVRTFLEMIEGNMVFDQFAQKPSIPRNMSGFPETFQSSLSTAAEKLKSVEFTGYLPLEMFDQEDNLAGDAPAAGAFNPFSSTASELVSQEISNIFTRRVNANIEMYSKKLPVGRLKMDVSLDRGTTGLVRLMGDMVGRSLDWLMQYLLLDNAVDNALGVAQFSDNNRDIQFVGANAKTTIAAAGGAGTASSPSTNVVGAPKNLASGGTNTGNAPPDWYTLDDLRVLKFLLDAERAIMFPGQTYVSVISPAIEERFLQDSDFIQAANYSSATEIYKAEIGQIYGMRVIKTRESGWVVGVQDDADTTEGNASDQSTLAGDRSAGLQPRSSGDVTHGVDVGTIMKPRQLLKDLVGGNTTYWQADSNVPSSALTVSTAPLVPLYAFGMDAYGMMPLEGWNADVSVVGGKSKSDPANLYSMLAFSVAFARAVLQARWVKVMLGAVDWRTLSTFQNETG